MLSIFVGISGFEHRVLHKHPPCSEIAAFSCECHRWFFQLFDSAFRGNTTDSAQITALR